MNKKDLIMKFNNEIKKLRKEIQEKGDCYFNECNYEITNWSVERILII